MAFLEQRMSHSRDASPILELNLHEDKSSDLNKTNKSSAAKTSLAPSLLSLSAVSSSVVHSPETATRTKNVYIAEEIAEKCKILDRTLKKPDNQSDLDSQASSTSLRIMSSSRDISSTNPNSVRLNLNRLASLEINRIGSPFKLKKSEIVSPADNKLKLNNCDNEKKERPEA